MSDSLALTLDMGLRARKEQEASSRAPRVPVYPPGTKFPKCRFCGRRPRLARKKGPPTVPGEGSVGDQFAVVPCCSANYSTVHEGATRQQKVRDHERSEKQAQPQQRPKTARIFRKAVGDR